MTPEEFEALKIREGWVPPPVVPPKQMSLQELADLIIREGGDPASYFTTEIADGTRLSIYGHRIDGADWYRLLERVRAGPKNVPVPAGKLSAAQWRSIAEGDAACEPRRRRR